MRVVGRKVEDKESVIRVDGIFMEGSVIDDFAENAPPNPPTNKPDKILQLHFNTDTKKLYWEDIDITVV